MTKEHDLPFVFTSEHALRRSIHKKYPNASPEILDETFEQMKKYIGWRKTTDEQGFTVWITPDGDKY